MKQTRGVRGAITIKVDKPDEVLSATKELITEIQISNPLMNPEDIAAVWFTVTDDINSEFPAKATREMGWKHVPLMCAQEISVPGSLSRCIRVMILWNTDVIQKEINHVYLGEAISLRPDLAIMGEQL